MAEEKTETNPGMEAKVWWQSKSLWFNAISFAVAALALTEFQSILPKEWLGGIASIIAVGNLAIRTWSTKGPVTKNERSAAAYNRNYGESNGKK